VLTSQTMQELDKKLRNRCSRVAATTGKGGQLRLARARKRRAMRRRPLGGAGCVEGASLWLLKVVTRASSYFGAP
jgi:hypothetical protein